VESVPGRVGQPAAGPSSLTTAVRVFTTRRPSEKPGNEEADEPRRESEVKRRYPHEALIFDTETLPGPAQNLRILVWRLYRDGLDETPGTSCIEEGIAYPDDLEGKHPEDLQLLREYVKSREADVAAGFPNRLRLESLGWWLEERFFRYGYAHRDRCSVVGFNLLFDLGRLASHWTAARSAYRGGYSLGIWGHFDEAGKWRDRKHRGRLQLRAIDPRRTLFRWASRTRQDPDPNRGPGRFVDLRTLAFALTDRSHTLESACKAFGDPFEKAEVDYSVLSPELLDYAREDVRHTAVLYRNCLAELRRHEGIELEPHRLYSPATVGARYLEAMRLRRPLVKFTRLTAEELGWKEPGQKRKVIDGDEPRGDLDPRFLGYAMSAFYGGRAEARIVRTEVPVAYVDFTSMYPSVNALLGTWRLLCAERLELVDATRDVRELLERPDLLERCLTPELWSELGVTFVELEPDGDVLPTRAAYDPATTDFGIGVNPLSYTGRLWYALPDVVAAVILRPLERGETKSPKVITALRLVPVGWQEELHTVRLRGAREIDPRRDDPFVCMIEERQRVRRDKELDKEERDRLDLFLKITANATSYGVLARFDRRQRPKPEHLNVFGPDEEPTEVRSETPEDPGPFCFPPVAASITAGARLMLALLERLVHDAGGSYAFCDTDSMAIVATPEASEIDCPTADGSDQIRALSWPEVAEILERFDELNPYYRELVPSPWKVEAESMTSPLCCYAISAKRYCLYRLSGSGDPDIVATVDGNEESDTEQLGEVENVLEDWSEHGLGLYLDPTSADAERPRRDEKGRRIWVSEGWRWILDDALGKAPPLPAWAGAYALTRFTVSSPRIERWFSGYSASRASEEAIRPGSFGLIAHPIALGAQNGPLPAAPYESDPGRWPTLEWYDRRSGRPVQVIAVGSADSETRAHALARGDVPIQLLGDVLAQYRRRAEHKSLDPSGRPAGRESKGLLLRRPISSSREETELVGKEGNKLEERMTAEVTELAEYRNSYGQRSETWLLVLEVLREIGAPRAAKLTEFGRSAAYEVLSGAVPRTDNRQEYEQVAVEFARERLLAWKVDVPEQGKAILARYLEERSERGEDVRRCEWCGELIPPKHRRDARFCSDRCRYFAARARRGG
jgi:hypothetical protein